MVVHYQRCGKMAKDIEIELLRDEINELNETMYNIYICLHHIAYHSDMFKCVRDPCTELTENDINLVG